MAGGKGSATVLVRIAGDATGLNKALTEAEVGSAGLAAKMGGLGGIAKVGALAAVGAVAGVGVAIFKVGQDFDEAYRQIRAATGATGVELQGLEQSMKNVFAKTPADMKDVAGAISIVHQRLNLVGKPLEDVTLQLIRLSRITKTDLNSNIESSSKVFQAWGVDVDEMGPTLDQVFRASQHSGVGVDKLTGQIQALSPALQTAGFGLDESIALLAQIDKAGGDAEPIIKGMTKAMTGFAKAGKDPAKELQNLIEEIKGTEDSTKALGKAAVVFGAKNAVVMTDAIRNGKLEFGDMLNIVKNGTETLAKAGSDTRTMAGAWKLLSHNLMVLVEPVATRVFGAVSDAVLGFTDKIRGLMDAFKTGGTEGFAKALDDLTGGGGRVHDAVLSVVRAFEAVGKWFADNKDTIFSVLSTIGEMAGTAIVTGIEGVGAAFRFIGDHLGIIAPMAAAIGAELLLYKTYTTAVWAIEGATKAWAGAVALVNLALEANPIILAATVILGIGVALYTAYQHSETFRLAVRNLGDEIWLAWDQAERATLTFFANTYQRFADFLVEVQHVIGKISPIVGHELGLAVDVIQDHVNTMNSHIAEINTDITFHVDAIQAREDAAALKRALEDMGYAADTARQKVSANWNLPTGFYGPMQPEPHAMGGPVRAGAPYLVGERGPELFMSSRNGAIVPNNQLGWNGGGGGGNTYNVTVQALSPNPADISKTVVDAIKEHEKRNGTGWRN